MVTKPAPETCPHDGQVSEPVRLTSAMVNRTIAVRPVHLLRRAHPHGSMRAFLEASRQHQRLPSFGKGRRE